MKLLLWVVSHALALGVAIWLFDDIALPADDRTDFVIQLAITGALFGVVSSFVKPIVQVLSIPLIVLSLGLMLVVINALMLMLTSRIAETLHFGFHVEGFWTAIWGGIVISIAGMVIEAVLPSRD